jgi:hypothetical protein
MAVDTGLARAAFRPSLRARPELFGSEPSGLSDFVTRPSCLWRQADSRWHDGNTRLERSGLPTWTAHCRSWRELLRVGGPPGGQRVSSSDRHERQSCIQEAALARTQGDVLERENAKPYLAVVHLSEVADDAPPTVPFGHLLWSVGLNRLKDGSAAPVIGPGITTWCLEVSLSKIAGGYLAGGLHLALLRHLWVEFMRAYDPDLIVVGGQTRFDDSWWRPLATAAR